jgi:hypothetical protein
MTGSPPAPLVPFLLAALALALAPAGSACSAEGSSPGLDASGASDASPDAGASGAGGNGGGTAAAGGNAGGGAAGSGAGTGGTPVGEAGRTGTAGDSGTVDAGADGAGPDLTRCPIRNCVERFAGLQAGCAAFGATCVKEVHGSQTNYCLANGVRTYLDGDGVTGLATMIRPDGHTCYTIYLTYSDNGVTTGAIRDLDDATIMLETDSSDNKTITFSCNGVQWVDDGVSCGAGGINSFPFFTVDCPRTNGQMCLRP